MLKVEMTTGWDGDKILIPIPVEKNHPILISKLNGY